MKDKIKNWKAVRWIKKKTQAVKRFFLASFEKTYYGSIVLSVLVSSILLTSLVTKSFMPILPTAVGFILSVIGVVLLAEILGLIVQIIFGMKKRNRIYWVIQFLCIAICALMAVQMNNVLFGLIFALAMAILVALLGRCLWALLRHRRVKVLLFICLAVSVGGLAAAIIFLSGEGSSKSYVASYLAMAEGKGRNAARSISLEKGPCQTGSLTYGPEEDSDIFVSQTFDLTPFAKQGFFDKLNRKKILGAELDAAPLRGKIWYPVGEKDCPVVFIVHGNHVYTEASYLGYDYLGEYLASFGYVMVSVDENICNDLSGENDGRAVLLLENMKYLLDLNRDASSKIYQIMDEDLIALAGHSRGGEAVSEAYLFNQYDGYPEDGNVDFSYHFPIKSIIAIAPTVDQYVPAQHEVALENVNYFIIHGANDQDVSRAMGQKQYENVSFTGEGEYLKTMLYLADANHGQFNSVWGKYDMEFPIKVFLNVGNFIEESRQKDVLKIFARTFLDVTLKGDKTNELLLEDYRLYEKDLPKTVYQQMYQTSEFVCLADFEQDSDLNTGSVPGSRIETVGLSEWTEEPVVLGMKNTKENYVMKAAWEEGEPQGEKDKVASGGDIDGKEPQISLTVPAEAPIDMAGKSVVFDLADLNEENVDMEHSKNEKAANAGLVDGMVTVEDAAGNRASVRISSETVVYPTLPVKLGKLDYLFGGYEYKHSFQTVTIPEESFRAANGAVDTGRIVKLTIGFDYSDEGSVWLDNIGLEGMGTDK